jgi:hypothetical protein
MRLEYRVTFGDYLLFSAVHQFLSVRLQALYLVLFWLIYTTEAKNGRLVALVFVGMLYLALWVVQLAFNAFYLYSSKNKTIVTTHVVEVRDDGFCEETPFNKSLHYWPGIARVVRRPGFVAVYTSAIAAHAIPRRAFASDEQLNQFVAMVRERMRAQSS